MIVKFEVSIDYDEPGLRYNHQTGTYSKDYRTEMDRLAREIHGAIDECNDPRIKQILVVEHNEDSRRM